MKHQIRLSEEHYHAAVSKFASMIKTDDKGFHVGDIAIIHEVCNGKETGRTTRQFVQYVNHNLSKGNCILGLSEDENEKYCPR